MSVTLKTLADHAAQEGDGVAWLAVLTTSPETSQRFAHNGVIATPSGNPIFLELIQRLVDTTIAQLNQRYNAPGVDMMFAIRRAYGQGITEPGRYRAGSWQLLLACFGASAQQVQPRYQDRFTRYGVWSVNFPGHP